MSLHRLRLSLPRTAPDGRRDLDLEIRAFGRRYHSIGRPMWVLYGALAWLFNRHGWDR